VPDNVGYAVAGIVAFRAIISYMSVSENYYMTIMIKVVIRLPTWAIIIALDGRSNGL